MTEPSKHLTTRPFRLTTKTDAAAFWDAQGHSSTEIAQLAGVNKGSVRRWRGHPEYQERVAYWRTMILSKLEPLIENTLLEYAKLVDAAHKEIARKMEAVDEHSQRPDEATRTVAIKLLFDSPVVKRLYAVPRQQGDDGDAAPAAPVSLHVHLTRDGQVIEAPALEEASIDAEFTELQGG